jgi:hypothetical protein
MLIKKKDYIEEDIQKLTDLLSQDFSLHQKFLIERELRVLQSPLTGQPNSTHFLEFYYKDNRDWALIHDLRIENNGYAAHFDHILINRAFKFFVFESKNFTYGIKITGDGEFLIYDGNRYQLIQSPFDENRKQVEFLESVLRENEIIPKKMGLTVKPKINSYILISPQSVVDRPAKSDFDSSMVIPGDLLIKALKKQTKKAKRLLNKFVGASKDIKKDPLLWIACRLSSLHKPIKEDYEQKFGIVNTPPPSSVDTCNLDTNSTNDYCI